MGMLGRSLPEAQFVITGVLGPGSNAHGPNEFLHIPTAERSPKPSPTSSTPTPAADTGKHRGIAKKTPRKLCGLVPTLEP